MNDNGPDYGPDQIKKARIRLTSLVVLTAGGIYLLLVLLSKIVYITPLDMNKVAALTSPSALHQVGSLPADICVINGVPLVLNANYEPALSGGPTLTYLRENGDLVVLKYSNTDYSRLVDTFVWSGGHCGAKASQ